jgi:hypothetical protein
MGTRLFCGANHRAQHSMIAFSISRKPFLLFKLQRVDERMRVSPGCKRYHRFRVAGDAGCYQRGNTHQSTRYEANPPLTV